MTQWRREVPGRGPVSVLPLFWEGTWRGPERARQLRSRDSQASGGTTEEPGGEQSAHVIKKNEVLGREGQKGVQKVSLSPQRRLGDRCCGLLRLQRSLSPVQPRGTHFSGHVLTPPLPLPAPCGSSSSGIKLSLLICSCDHDLNFLFLG